MNMSAKQIRERVEIMIAYADGKTIQTRGFACTEWFDNSCLSFDGSVEYRIKPEPEPEPPKPKPEPPKPWNMNTCPILPFEILRKDKQIRTIVDFVTIHEAGIGYRGALTYQNLLDQYTLTDGSPCGVTQ